MGNILKCFIRRCFDGEDELDGGSGHGHFTNCYAQSSRLHYQPLQPADLQVPLSPPPRPRRQQQLPPPPAPSLRYHHGVGRLRAAEVTAQGPAGFLNSEFTSTVCEGPKHHITSSRKTDLNRCINKKDNGSSNTSYCLPKSKDDHVVNPRIKRPPGGVAALEHDLLHFMRTNEVCEGPKHHITSSRKTDLNRCINKKDNGSSNTSYCLPKSKDDHVVNPRIKRPPGGVAALEHDLLHFMRTNEVCEGPKHHITSSRKTDLNRCINKKDNGSSNTSYCLPKSKDDHVVNPRIKRPPGGVAALEHDLLHFMRTNEVCEGPKHHITSSRKTDLNRCINKKDHGSSNTSSYWVPKSKDDHVVNPRIKRPPGPPGGVAALEHDLLHFMRTIEVPEGLAQHVTSPMTAQVTWYRKILAAYEGIKSPPKESADATVLVTSALRGIERTNLEGVLAFYGFPLPTISKEASEKHPSSIPKDVLFVLKTLPVNEKRIVDGDGFTAYVDTLNPIELREDCNSSCQAPNSMEQKLWDKRATDLQMSLQKNTGQKEMFSGDRKILARTYEIRLRGIDAPEMGMQYGKESQDALVKLIARKCVTLHVYEQDKFNRFVCDIHCGGVFIQEQMLVNGHAWHFKNFDKRPQFAEWEKMAQDARRGLWAYDNPEKPWEWRKNNKWKKPLEWRKNNKWKKPLKWRKNNKWKASQHHKSGVVLSRS